jgi:uncharacterized protein involved in exopolysaccharide biosynthesis
VSDPGPPPPHARSAADDEVSLRELALILRRGLPAILVATVLAAAAALAWAWLAPDAYEARATVVSSPNQVRLGEDVALNFDVRGAIDVATLRSIATSRSTYDDVRAALEADGVTPPDGRRALEAAGGLETLTGGDGGASALTVVLRVTREDPDQAAATRKRVMDMAAADRLEVAGAHIDYPGFGHLTAEGRGYAFAPGRWDHELG